MSLTLRTITNAGAPLYSPDGTLLGNTQIVFELVDAVGLRVNAWDAVTLENVGGPTIATTTTDAGGEFSVALWPTSRANKAVRYRCRVVSDGFLPFTASLEDGPLPLQWALFMASGTPLTPQEISLLEQYLALIEQAKDDAEAAAAGAATAADDAIIAHVALPDPHTQYAKESDLGTAAATDSSDYATAAQGGKADTALQSSDIGTAAGTVAAGNDARLTDARPPTGGAGGVLSGNYPNPGFAVDMATQTELDNAIATREPTITAGTAAQYRRGDKTWQTLNKAAVGLGNADNTADSAKPVSTAQAAAIATATAIHPFLLIGA